MKYQADPFGCRYASIDDIRTKLNACYIMYDGKPVYVSVGGSNDYRKITLHELREDGEFRQIGTVNVNDPKVNQYEFNLGWFNMPLNERLQGNAVAFGERMPVRRWKQGLCCDSVIMTVHNKDKESRFGPTNRELVAMMSGKYTSLEEAIRLFDSPKRELFTRGSQGVALSREVALMLPPEPWTKDVKYFDVFVGKMKIGKFHPRFQTMETTKEGMFSVVQETLREVGIR